jgi:two-component system alkaline phosphatase synthesis response regulator PhoP
MTENTYRILIVDDEPEIRRFLRASLRNHQHEVIEAENGTSAIFQIREKNPDLIILDLGLPDIDGLGVTQRVREWSQIPIIILSVRSSEVEKIKTLNAGADDYLTKPFSPRELIARIKAALRRIQTSTSITADTQVLNFAHIRLDISARRVWVEDNLIELTSVEFDLLLVLAQHQSMVLTREQLLEKVWGYDYFGDTRVVDVHIGHIRQKLGKNDIIETIRGVGYRFEDK